MGEDSIGQETYTIVINYLIELIWTCGNVLNRSNLHKINSTPDLKIYFGTHLTNSSSVKCSMRQASLFKSFYMYKLINELFYGETIIQSPSIDDFEPSYGIHDLDMSVSKDVDLRRQIAVIEI